MSGGSSLKDTDFSNDTDLSAIDVDQHIFAWYMCVKSVRSVYVKMCIRPKRISVMGDETSAGFRNTFLFRLKESHFAIKY